MTNPFEDENGEYLVLVNHELQYSLWPSYQKIPDGWSPTSMSGSRKDCLAWVETNWKDMRPLSLAREMDRNRQ